MFVTQFKHVSSKNVHMQYIQMKLQPIYYDKPKYECIYLFIYIYIYIWREVF